MQSEIRDPQSAIFIVGPTAVGKSDVAIELAAQLDAEIVNADAFQLYAGLDLLTAKPSSEAQACVRHHLVGSFPLSESMSVARYLEEARRAVAEITSQGRRAVVVGGTGFYLRALTHGVTTGPASDPALRAQLATLPAAETLEQLRSRDPDAFARVDRSNLRRVQRALEIAILRSAAGSKEGADHLPGILPPSSPHPLGVLLQRDRADLLDRIARRTDEMFRRGVLNEVAAMDPAKVGPTAACMIGWRECLACLRGELSETDARERITIATRQYAKRQMTWFKRETDFLPLALASDEAAATTASRVMAALGEPTKS
ncbi:hypothetical protein AYO41_05270 [Verrucomicrobia bacterium SCGC AG-212-E04]|nr:hypothetical protein AYO41_05270 [Verrucomicrobia bacterium SCGC AG-212-E04]